MPQTSELLSIWLQMKRQCISLYQRTSLGSRTAKGEGDVKLLRVGRTKDLPSLHERFSRMHCLDLSQARCWDYRVTVPSEAMLENLNTRWLTYSHHAQNVRRQGCSFTCASVWISWGEIRWVVSDSLMRVINNLASKTKEPALTVATNYVIVYNTVTCWSDYRRGLDWRLDLLTTYTQDSWLHLIIAPSLISTPYKSLQNTLSLSSLLCLQ
jgi:hypothetical protein